MPGMRWIATPVAVPGKHAGASLRRAILHVVAVALAACAAAGTAAPAARADDVPARNQAQLVLRVLIYDRNLKVRAGEVVRVAVMFRAGDAASEAERDALLAAYREGAHELVAQGLPVKVEAVAWSDAAGLAAQLGGRRFAALHAGRTLAPAAQELAQAARTAKTLGFAPALEMVESGLAVGLVPRGDRAGLVVNVAAARAEGADLDPVLLQMAEAVR
jgi:hypothetical protein